jgi:uncharacterized membrane protein
MAPGGRTATAFRSASMLHREDSRKPPVLPGTLIGIGLGGLFDGIVLHQILQWHHLLTSAGHPASTLEGLQANTFWDGLFHLITWLSVVAGLTLLWRSRQRYAGPGSGIPLTGSLLAGFGGFNLVEGLLNHHLLGLHHVNETVPHDQWLYWDLGFLLWGGIMLAVGIGMLRTGGRERLLASNGGNRSPLRHTR